MLENFFLKRLIKRKKNKENEFLKESSLSFFFFRILALSYFPNTIYPATTNTQQHHNMKSNPNIECLAKKIPIPSQNLMVAEFACYFQYFRLHVAQDNVIPKL